MNFNWRLTTNVAVEKKLEEIELHKNIMSSASNFFLIKPLPYNHRTWTQLQLYDFLAKNVIARYSDLTPKELLEEILSLTEEFKRVFYEGKKLGELQ